MTTDAILFDLDGTLWDSVPEVLSTWNLVISRHPGLRAPITLQEQQSLMGLQMDEIARRVFSGEPADRQSALMEECVQAENDYLYRHGARLYPGVRETLELLHRKYPLLIVSNCQSGYIEAFLHAHKLERCFDDFISFGDTGRSKGENLIGICRKHAYRHPVYVGDTQGDQDAADYAGVPFIYAAYGFGTSSKYAARIHSFRDLTGVIS